MIKPASTPQTKTLWYVYILRCADKTLYTGVTTDTERRLGEHNSSKGGARYTRVRQPVKMLWFEECDSRSSACKREAAIKKLTRPQKLALIKSK